MKLAVGVLYTWKVVCAWAGAVAVGSSSVASTMRGVVARLRERLQRVLQRRRADDGRRGVEERPGPVRARAAGQPGRQRAGLGGRDDGRRRRRGRAAGHRQRGRHDRRCRAGGQPPTSNACAGPSRDRCHPHRLPLNLRRSLRGLQRARAPGIRADGQKARVDHLVKCSRRASKAAWTVADPAVSSAPSRSSRRAPSPSASSSERCARSSCWASCAAGATTIEWSFDHRPGGLRGAGSAVVPGSIERSLAASRRGRRGCDPGSSRGVQGRRSTSGTWGSAAGSAGRQTVVTGRQMTARRGVVTGPSEDPRQRVTAGRRRNLLGRALRNVPGFPTPVRGSSRRASEGLPGPSWEAFAGAVWRRCGGLMRRPRRVFARAWRGSIDGWSRSPAGASRGRYGEVVSAPPDASEVGSIGTSSRVSARAVTGPPSGVAGAV